MNTLTLAKDHLNRAEVEWLFDQRALDAGIEAIVILEATHAGRGLRIWTQDDEAELTIAHCDRTGYPNGTQMSLTNPTPEMVGAAIEMMRASVA